MKGNRRSEGLCKSFLIDRGFWLNCQILGCRWERSGEREGLGLQGSSRRKGLCVLSSLLQIHSENISLNAIADNS